MWKSYKTISLIFMLLLVFCSEIAAVDDQCHGFICGNKQFFNSTLIDTMPHPAVKILVYSVWVGEPLQEHLLNHKQYCDENGYKYQHFSISAKEFGEKYSYPWSAWYSVYVAKMLLETSDADYFFKMDIDCVFARTDVRLESLIDPLQRYSFYITNTEGTSRFMQSQSWILKNSEYSKAFIKEWLEYVHWGNCGNLAYEQGAMHLTIGTMYSLYLGSKGTKFDCPLYCNKLRSTFKHHHCVLDWLEDNGFGMAGSMNTHPHIYVYPYQPSFSTAYNSPEDGFMLQIKNSTLLGEKCQPLTVHPLKHHIYASPHRILKLLRTNQL